MGLLHKEKTMTISTTMMQRLDMDLEEEARAYAGALTSTRTRRERALMAVALLDAEAVEVLSELSRAADMVSAGGCRFAGMQPA